MSILERTKNSLVLSMSDGIAVIDTTMLIMGDDEAIIGHFFHDDTPVVAQPIKRYSAITQMILQYLINGT